MNKNITFFLFFLVVSNFMFCQKQEIFTKDVLTISPEKSRPPLIKNTDATELVVDGFIIDKRAVKYYIKGDLEKVSIEKAKRVNAIYVTSYKLVTPQSKLSLECLTKLKNEFDLGEYNIYRKTEERVTVPIKWNGCEFEISLFSWNEIKNAN